MAFCGSALCDVAFCNGDSQSAPTSAFAIAIAIASLRANVSLRYRSPSLHVLADALVEDVEGVPGMAEAAGHQVLAHDDVNTDKAYIKC